MLYPTEECSEMYQIIKWGCFGGTVAYLALILFKASHVDWSDEEESWPKKIGEFVGSIWVHFLVLPLLLMSMVAFPPLECYTGSDQIVTLIGVSAVLVIGFIAYIRVQCSKGKKGKDRKPKGGNEGDHGDGVQ